MNLKEILVKKITKTVIILYKDKVVPGLPYLNWREINARNRK